jgi:hypothetical protein
MRRVSDPMAKARGLQAPLLSSPLAHARSRLGGVFHVPTLGWPLSPRLSKPGVKQADGG